MIYDLDKILKEKKEPKKIKIFNKEWTLNFSTKAGLFMSAWIEKHKDNLEKVEINNLLELLKIIIVEKDFLDMILDLEISQATEISYLVMEFWSSQIVEKNDCEKKK